ncbi:MAG: putative sugar O-methyltransferase [Candidatus Limnocylindria bacterium]
MLDVTIGFATLIIAIVLGGGGDPAAFLWILPFVLVARAAASLRARLYQGEWPPGSGTELRALAASALGSAILGYGGVYVMATLFLAALVPWPVPAIDTLLYLLAAAAIRVVAPRSPHNAAVTAAEAEAPVAPELAEMLAVLRRADPIYQPSRFWEELKQRHLNALAAPGGTDRFKRTLNASYFQFGLPGFWSALPRLLLRWLRSPDRAVIGAHIEDARGSRFSDRLLALVIALYAHALRTGPCGGLLSTIQEPAMGDPLFVRYSSLRVTEDLCHSVEEFCSVVTGLPPDTPMTRVAEIGAGYGRLAYVFLRARSDVQYHIIDIPPALYVSQSYLTAVLPDLAVFRFRHFSRYSEVAEEMARARIVFLEPQQMALLPDRHLDVFMTISTLHEMRWDQLAHLLALAGRTSSRALYLKQWMRFRNPADNLSISLADYPIPPGWKPLFRRRALVPASFFEALYVREESIVDRTDSR